jgi:NADPH2:quinone reductase
MPAQSVCKLPDAISFETGAAMMLKGLTAQYLLKRTLPQGGLQAGDFVLFHAAAGGVGLIACQWAAAMGLQLIGTAGSDAKCALAKANGAAHVINYASEDFAARGSRTSPVAKASKWCTTRWARTPGTSRSIACNRSA